MHSEPGDYVGAGRDYLYGSPSSTFSSVVYDWSQDGLLDYVAVHVRGPSFSDAWNVEISTSRMSNELAPGDYEGAEYVRFPSLGRPGLSVSGLGRACVNITGRFTVVWLEIDHSGDAPRLVRLALSFEQHCEGGKPGLVGTLLYRDASHPPGPAPDLTGIVSRMRQTCRGSDRAARCSLMIQFQVVNLGDSRAAPSVLRVFLSPAPTFQENAVLLRSVRMRHVESGDLAMVTVRARLPRGVSASGKYVFAVSTHGQGAEPVPAELGRLRSRGSGGEPQRNRPG